MTVFPLEGTQKSRFQKFGNVPLENAKLSIRPCTKPPSGEIPCSILMEINGVDEAQLTGEAKEQHIIKSASGVVTTFRLTRERGIGYSQRYEGTGFQNVKGALPYRWPENREVWYQVDDKVLGDLKKNLEKHFLVKWNHPENYILKLALSRFNRSYDEINEEDVLLDLMICLEILFVGDKCVLCSEKTRTKTTTLQNCVSELIDPDELRDVKIKVKIAYEIRNRLVHKGHRLKDAIDEILLINRKDQGIKRILTNIDAWVFVIEIRAYARECLLFYIDKLSKPLTTLTASKMKKSPRLLFGT